MKQLTDKLARDLDRNFDEVVLTFQQPLFAYAYRMSGSAEDAEETVQDVFVRAYRALQEYEVLRIRELALKAWLYRICVNQLRNRHRRTRPRTTEFDDEQAGAAVGSDPVSESYLRSETGSELAALVARLPAIYRSPLILRFVNDLSYGEIASALEQPEGTVKSNVHRGLKALRKMVDQTAGSGSALSVLSLDGAPAPAHQPSRTASLRPSPAVQASLPITAPTSPGSEQ